MIYAKLSDAPAYRGIHPRLDRALALLTPEFLASVETQTQKLEEDDLYVTRFDVITSREEGRLFEYHRDYLDIFTLAAGEERVDIAEPEAVALCELPGPLPRRRAPARHGRRYPAGRIPRCLQNPI